MRFSTIRFLRDAFSRQSPRNRRRKPRENLPISAEIFEAKLVLSVTAVDDTVIASHNIIGSVGQGNVLDNDTYPDINTLTISAGATTGPGSFTLEDDPASGALGSYTYTPAPGVFADTATLDYTITDSVSGNSSSATLTMTFTNDKPLNTEVSFFMEAGYLKDVEISLDEDVLFESDPYAYDPDGDTPLDIVSLTVTEGTVQLKDGDPRIIVYTPPADGFVSETGVEIEFYLQDGGGLVADQKTKVKVKAVGGPTGPGIYIISHQVLPWPGNDRHTAVVIIPTDQADWKTHPRFNKKAKFGGVELNYLTLSAAASGAGGTGFLNNDDNRPTDDPTKSTNRVDQKLSLPTGTLEDGMIQRLLDLDAAYDDNQLGYDSWINVGDDEFNSNGFVHGLLDAAGFATDPKDEALHPGWRDPVLPQHFQPD